MNESISAPFFAFEKNFDKHVYQTWMNKYWSAGFYMGLAYVILLFTGQSYMRSKPPFRLNKFLIVWNLSLSVFSLLGTLRTFPELSNVLKYHGLHDAVCSRSFADNNVTAVWGWIFTISKGPELVDTAFLVLRKRELIFLHWYHHFSTVSYSWYVYGDHPSIARAHVVMNYAVHAIMYFYFFLRASGIKTPRVFAMFITASQIVQLILGTVIPTYAFYVKIIMGQDCGVSNNVILASMAIYFTLMILFVRFFYYNYYVISKSKIHKKSS